MNNKIKFAYYDVKKFTVEYASNHIRDNINDDENHILMISIDNEIASKIACNPLINADKIIIYATNNSIYRKTAKVFDRCNQAVDINVAEQVINNIKLK